MTTATLYSLSAIAGVIAGIFIILGTLLNDLLKTARGTVFNFLGALIGLLGMTGFYLAVHDRFPGYSCARSLSNRHFYRSQHFRRGDHLVEYLSLVPGGRLMMGTAQGVCL